MRAFCVVGDEPFIEHLLHLLNGLKPGLAAFNTEVFVEHGAVEALDDAVGLRAAHPGRAMVDLFQLQEQFVGVPVRAPASRALMFPGRADALRAS